MLFRLALPPAWRRPRGARRSLTIPAALALTAALAVLATAPATAASAAPHHGAVAPKASGFGVAPYADMSNSQESLLDTAITQHGLKAFTAAFVIGVGCNEEWGDTEPIGNDPFIDPEISRAKSEGASVIISSGGADGEPLAWTCTNQSTIDSDYRQIISDYSPSGLDFDIEGAAQADTAAATRNFQAMKDLGVGNFSVTLPVLPSGLTNYGIGILQAAQNLGVKIPIVNIMAMDYYQGTGTEMGQAAIQAAQSTMAQMKSINSSYTYANLGVTPMIGINDDGSTFTPSDASTLVNWANSNGVGRLAFWAVTRDQSCPGGNGGGASSTCSGVSESQLGYTSAFTGFNGGGGGSYPPGYHQLVANNSNLCADVSGASTSNNAAVIQYTCSGSANQEWQFNAVTNGYGELQSQHSGKDLVVAGASKSNGAKIIQYTQNGTTNGLWLPMQLSNGSWQFKNDNSGECLDVTGASTSINVQLDQWPCKSSAAGGNQAFATR